jgi:Uma2 family endonuclease
LRSVYTADGELIIMPPNNPDSGIRNSAINRNPSRGFLLSNGARRSPDAAWMTRGKRSTAFAVTRELRIRRALAFDAHFSEQGFALV